MVRETVELETPLDTLNTSRELTLRCLSTDRFARSSWARTDSPHVPSMWPRLPHSPLTGHYSGSQGPWSYTASCFPTDKEFNTRSRSCARAMRHPVSGRSTTPPLHPTPNRTSTKETASHALHRFARIWRTQDSYMQFIYIFIVI